MKEERDPDVVIQIEKTNLGEEELGLFTLPMLFGGEVSFTGDNDLKVVFPGCSPFESHKEIFDIPSAQKILEKPTCGIYLFHIKRGNEVLAHHQLAVGDCEVKPVHRKVIFDARAAADGVDVCAKLIHQKSEGEILHILLDMLVVNSKATVSVIRGGDSEATEHKIDVNETSKPISVVIDESKVVRLKLQKKQVKPESEQVGLVGESGGTKTIDIIAEPPNPED